MDVMELPWLDPDDSASNAVKALIAYNRRRKAKVGGVVTHVAGVPKIIAAAAIIKAARAAKDRPLARVKALAPAVEFIVGSKADPAFVETRLDAMGAGYGVAPAEGPVTRVFSRREGQMGMLRVHVAVCICPLGHVSLPEQLHTPGTCNKCPRRVTCS